MEKQLEQIKERYGEHLYQKGLELLDSPDPQALEATINKYLLSEEFLELLRKEHEKYEGGKELFKKLLALEDEKRKKELIILLYKILEL